MTPDIANEMDIVSLGDRLKTQIIFFEENREDFSSLLGHLDDLAQKNQLTLKESSFSKNQEGFLEAQWVYDSLKDFHWSLVVDCRGPNRIFALNIKGDGPFDHFWVGNGGFNGKWVVIKHSKKKSPTKSSVALARYLCSYPGFVDLEGTLR